MKQLNQQRHIYWTLCWKFHADVTVTIDTSNYFDHEWPYMKYNNIIGGRRMLDIGFSYETHVSDYFHFYCNKWLLIW